MSQSAIWDALSVVGDALEAKRFDVADAVLATMDAEDAWAFAVTPPRLGVYRRGYWARRRPAPVYGVTNLSSLTAMYKQLYPPQTITDMAMAPHPLLSKMAMDIATKGGTPDVLRLNPIAYERFRKMITPPRRPSLRGSLAQALSRLIQT